MRRTGTGRYRFGATGISFKWPVAADGLGKRVAALPERQDGQDRALRVRLATVAAVVSRRWRSPRPPLRPRSRRRRPCSTSRPRRQARSTARSTPARARRSPRRRCGVLRRLGGVRRRRGAAGLRVRHPTGPREPALAAGHPGRRARGPLRGQQASVSMWVASFERASRSRPGRASPGVERARQLRPARGRLEPVRPARGRAGAARAGRDRLRARLHRRLPRLRQHDHRRRHHLQPGRLARTPRSSPAPPRSRGRPTRASSSSATSPTPASTARSTARLGARAGRRSRSPGWPRARTR